MTRRWTYLQGADLDHVVAEARRLYEGGSTGCEIRAELGLTEMQMRRVARIADIDDPQNGRHAAYMELLGQREGL